MHDIVWQSIAFLISQSGASLFTLFWFVIIFEIPRYTLGFIATLATTVRPKHNRNFDVPRLSVVIAGHNEEDAIERCVISLREQSRPPDEIIVVSDGSTDRMPAKLQELQRRGLIQQAHCTQMRGGKSAGVNLAVGRTTGDIVVNVDCDCTFDRHALKRIIEPFADPRIGAVAGNILVRNPEASVIAACQRACRICSGAGSFKKATARRCGAANRRPSISRWGAPPATSSSTSIATAPSIGTRSSASSSRSPIRASAGWPATTWCETQKRA